MDEQQDYVTILKGVNDQYIVAIMEYQPSKDDYYLGKHSSPIKARDEAVILATEWAYDNQMEVRL